jgi:galactokinase
VDSGTRRAGALVCCAPSFYTVCRSGAAVQLAVAMSLAKLYDWPGYNLNRATTEEEQYHIRMRLVQLCHAVENDVVGVPCGIFDQTSSALGEQARILRLHFGFSPVAVRACAVGNGSDENLKMNLWVFATGVRHELADALYKTRSHECQDAAAALGLRVLSDCSLSHLEASRDALTETQYMRAKHVIEENHRVHSCVKVNFLFAKSFSKLSCDFVPHVSVSSKRLFNRCGGVPYCLAPQL